MELEKSVTFSEVMLCFNWNLCASVFCTLDQLGVVASVSVRVPWWWQPVSAKTFGEETVHRLCLIFIVWIIGYVGYIWIWIYICLDCRSQWPRDLRSRYMAARLLRSWVQIPPGAWMFSVVCCHVEVSATGWSLLQRSPTDCGASLCVIKKPRMTRGP
jgi:hypothetical protein